MNNIRIINELHNIIIPAYISHTLKRTYSATDNRVKHYINFARTAHGNYQKQWSKTDFIPAFRDWHYQHNVAKDTYDSVPYKPKTIEVDGIIYQSVKSTIFTCNDCALYGLKEYISPHPNGNCRNPYKCNAVVRWIPQDKPILKPDTMKIVEIQNQKYQVNRKRDKIFPCTNCDLDKNCPFRQNNSISCIDFCHANKINTSCYFTLLPNQKPIPKPFTINDVPENAILICRNGAIYKKYGNKVVYLFRASDGSYFNNLMNWDTAKMNWDTKLKGNNGYAAINIISIKEVIIGPELMQPEILKYSVVDTEDTVVHQLESTKELHLVKEKV